MTTQSLRHTIALIGLSGVGKSTLGQQLAQQLGWKFVDTDAMISRFAGKSVAEYFATKGEVAFRKLESEVLGAMLVAATYHPCVIATGGGIVVQAENRDLLHQFAWNVWLDAPDRVLLQRLQSATTEARPLLQGDDLLGKLAAMRAVRAPLYRELAHLTLDTSHLSNTAIISAITREFGLRVR